MQYIKTSLATSLLFVAALLYSTDAPATLPATTSVEIERLLVSLRNSGCEFYRNSSWYSAAMAESHLRKKYEYGVDQNLFVTTEQFIDKMASISSLSGKPYLVKCNGVESIQSRVWFHTELGRLRNVVQQK